jgi:hypothetical protein
MSTTKKIDNRSRGLPRKGDKKRVTENSSRAAQIDKAEWLFCMYCDADDIDL